LVSFFGPLLLGPSSDHVSKADEYAVALVLISLLHIRVHQVLDEDREPHDCKEGDEVLSRLVHDVDVTVVGDLSRYLVPFKPDKARRNLVSG
tara:strand:+ start:211 stop:486 length:276 start_codon:yes stop_codon:yes gene_type:complete